jgi:transcriptional regulator with XRE-family HTH domain
LYKRPALADHPARGERMARSTVVVETLKRELRSRGITYAAVARHLEISEASVKRLFAQKEFSLSRIDRICDLAGIEFSELARMIVTQDAVISMLTYEQEKEFIDNPKLMLVALCTLNHWTFDQIVASYELTAAECVKLLARLDKLKFIELLPDNRIRLLVSRAFAWIPDGPIQRLFKEQFQVDFFRSRFDGDKELLLLANGSLSKPSIAALLARLRKTAAEFSDMRSDDSSLPATERAPITLLLAARPWAAEFLRKFRRKSVAPATARACAARVA